MLKPHKRKYTRHPLSAAFGDMSETERAALGKSLKDEGLNNPLYVDGNQIIDGWNRYCAAQKVGFVFKEADFIEYDPEQDGDMVQLVKRLNLHRRHLSDADKIRIVRQLIAAGSTVKDAAAAVDMHPKSVSRANSKKVTPVTLESLQKKEAKILKDLEKVRDEISKLKSISKPAAPVRRIARGK